ncbi:S-locus glycoprotein [Corchorus olitorius]|uniref:Receptor-like serine/threonine-protein kinase n=1 Tax=Corchorus olitorius TaxID=93759 RepID=A0A1R3KBY3_9ROSI|nr:S-locus glycoprotein [Corchorus olitorius]
MDILCLTTCFLLIISSKVSKALDMISPSDSLTDGMTLVSNDGSFELGFFTPGSSKNRYLGIWYKNIPIPMQTVVWVANRINPITDFTGLLKIETTGKVVLQGQNRTTTVWSTNSSTEEVGNPILQLLDSGNLVVKDGNSENYVWQSFDYPTDTILPGMKMGWDLRTGLSRRLVAWKNPDDPSPGDLTFGVELEGNPEIVIRKGSTKYSRSGLWNGDGFSGAPVYRSNPVFTYDFVWNEEEVYYIYFLKDKSVMSRFFLNQTEGAMDRYTWNPETQTWNLFHTIPNDYCDRYGVCGANGTCDNSKFPVCQCLKAFNPKSPESWNSSDWSQGCIHNKPLNCQGGDGFIRIQGVKTPDATHSWVNKSMDLKECRVRCLKNCSCMAYTSLYITGTGSGCAMWFGDLMDIKQQQSYGQDLYIRVSASESEELKKKHTMKLSLIIATPITVLSGLLVVTYYIRRSRGKLKDNGENEDLEHEVFELGTISRATDGFSSNNKLGQGDKRRCKVLDWPKRFQIICGIARGLLYLHQDSRLRIIHRDLKASNVLLDSEMNPKISDFGLARTFGADQTEANTNRVVGTYGYMAPEYAIDGLFSVKSDVFSFGILLLEIISATKNRGFSHPDHSGNLIEHAWRLWKEGRPLELADDFLANSDNLSEIVRCIHISLLCVQQHPEWRPTMSSVVLMLGSENELPIPKQPGFLLKSPFETDSSSGNDGSSSKNEVSLSLLEPR